MLLKLSYKLCPGPVVTLPPEVAEGFEKWAQQFLSRSYCSPTDGKVHAQWDWPSNDSTVIFDY